MKLEKVIIAGYRGFKAPCEIEFDDLTAFIGKNDSGKSSIFDALDCFFNPTAAKPELDDYSIGGKEEFRVRCIFGDLPDKVIIDTSNVVSFADEHLLNSDGKLAIEKVFKGKTAKLSDTFLIANHPSAQNADDLLPLTINDLRTRAKEMGISVDKIDQRKKSEIRQAIWQHVGDLKLKNNFISIGSSAKGDLKSVAEKLDDYMPIFALYHSDREGTDGDKEAQDPLKAAVKQVIKEAKKGLDDVKGTINEALEGVAKRVIEKIEEMEPNLAKDLQPNFPEPKWEQIFKISLTGDESVPINKRGSGFRRLVLINFFRAETEKRAKEEKGANRDVIYAIEEPETAQHPDHQKMIYNTLHNLADEENCQVMLTTHTPMLGQMFPVNTIRYVKWDRPKRAVINSVTEEHFFNEICDSLGILPDNKVRVLVVVEGPRDIEFLHAVSKTLKKSNPESYIDLEEKGAKDEILMLSAGGANLKHISAVKKLNRPIIQICDSDMEHEPFKDSEKARTFQTKKRSMENYITPKRIKEHFEKKFGTLIDANKDGGEDVVETIRSCLKKNGNDATHIPNKKRIKEILNHEVAATMTPDEIDPEVKGWLEVIKEKWENPRTEG